MPYITKIPLGKIKVVPNLKNARVGALLQGAPPQIRIGRATVAQPPKFFYAALSKQPMWYMTVLSL